MSLRSGIAAALICLLGNGVSAQQKQDLRGFVPGMTASEYNQQIDRLLDERFKAGQGVSGTLRWWIRAVTRVRPEKCSPDVNASSNVSCTIGRDTFDVAFTDYLKPAVVKSVSLIFRSDEKPRPLIDQISSQYGIRSEQMLSDQSESMVYGFSWIGVRGNIAKWRISDDLLLELNGYKNYELKLRSVSIEKREKEASSAQSEKTNLSPKF